jgi:hypothetical protein
LALELSNGAVFTRLQRLEGAIARFHQASRPQLHLLRPRLPQILQPHPLLPPLLSTTATMADNGVAHNGVADAYDGKDIHEHQNEKVDVHHDADLNAGARRASVTVAGNIVHNPLQSVTKAQAVLDAEAWAAHHGMAEHASLFGRAALVARDPSRFEMLTEIDEEERAKLIYERDHKWNGSFMLWYSIGLCAIGAATQGWDQTGSNGANLSFPEEFNIGPHSVNSPYSVETREWLVGLINAIIFLTAGLM